MDRPKSEQELKEYFEAVVLVAAITYVQDLQLLADRHDVIVEFMVKHEPFRKAIRVGFDCGFNEGRRFTD